MRQGSETPRVWTPPLRDLTPETSLGFRCIAFAELLGVTLLPWQQWLCIHLLELLPDGRLRFRTAVVLVAPDLRRAHVRVLPEDLRKDAQ